MKTLKIKIKPFEVYADPADHESVFQAIIEHLEEVSEEAFFGATVVDDEEEPFEDEELV